MSSEAKREAPPGYLHNMTPPATMLVTALAVALLLNFLLQGSSLWYWLPLQYYPSAKLYALATEKKHYDIVILGSSVSEFGLLPRVMEEELDRLLPRPEPWLVYNTSTSGGFLPSLLEISRHILGLRQKPQLVIVMLSPRSLNSAADMNLDIQLFTTGADDFFTVMRHTPRNEARWAAVNSLAHGIQVLFQTPLLLRDRGRIRQTQKMHGASIRYPFTEEAMRENAKILPPVTRSLAELQEERAKKMREQFLLDFNIQPLADRWVHKIVARLKRENVKVIVTMAPESSWFVANVYRDEREKSASYLAGIAAREGLIYFDLSRPPYNFKDADFWDGCDHLEPPAAERLSRSIVAHLLVPALSSPER